jgi:signal transduction histidine kinase
MVTKQALERHNAQLEATIKSRTEELRNAVDAAETANEAKSSFLASMSHELRTPLHGILSFARFGKRRIESATKAKLLEYFDRIEDCGETLLRLVDQLLDLAKLESGVADVDMDDCDLCEIVQYVVQELYAVAEEQGVQLNTTGLSECCAVHADRDRIAQVLRNLIRNAINVSSVGDEIAIEMTARGNDVAVRVIDQGPGIPSDELESIFDKFVQSSRTKTGAGGTGLGLTISRELIDRHGGRMWADNVSPHGAAVCFEIARSDNVERRECCVARGDAD